MMFLSTETIVFSQSTTTQKMVETSVEIAPDIFNVKVPGNYSGTVTEQDRLLYYGGIDGLESNNLKINWSSPSFLTPSSMSFPQYVESRLGILKTEDYQKVIDSEAALNKADTQSTTNNQPKTYQPLAGIKGATKDSEQTGLKEILNFIFTWGIRVAVLLAIIMIIFGGVEYMTSDAVFNKEDGIHKINAAIIGLILTLSAWLILYTINPRIVEEPNSALFGPKTK